MSKNLGVDIKECQIILVEKFPCDCKYELLKRERYFIENFECVNKIIPTRTKKEYYEKYKEEIKKKTKDYRNNNKEKIAKNYKEYRIKNKESLLIKKKEYYEKYKEEIAKKNKEYAINNKEKIKEYWNNNKEKRIKKDKRRYEKHKKKILEQKKEYYEKNKKKILEKKKIKITCQCGSNICKSDLKRHLKSKKHINFINSNSSIS
jgi:hypothetical protein